MGARAFGTLLGWAVRGRCVGFRLMMRVIGRGGWPDSVPPVRAVIDGGWPDSGAVVGSIPTPVLPAQPGPVLRERERELMGAREFGWLPAVGESYRVAWRANPSITATVRVKRIRRGRVRVIGQTGQVFVLSFDDARDWVWQPVAVDPFAL